MKEETDLCSEMNLNSSDSLLSHLHTRTYIQYITYKIYYMYISYIYMIYTYIIRYYVLTRIVTQLHRIYI